MSTQCAGISRVISLCVCVPGSPGDGDAVSGVQVERQHVGDQARLLDWHRAAATLRRRMEVGIECAAIQFHQIQNGCRQLLHHFLCETIECQIYSMISSLSAVVGWRYGSVHTFSRGQTPEELVSDGVLLVRTSVLPDSQQRRILEDREQRIFITYHRRRSKNHHPELCVTSQGR